MASKVVEDAIEDYLAANWANSSIFTENQQNQTPEDGSPFIILQFPAASTVRPIINSQHYQEDGSFRVVINVARGQGVTTMRDWGEELAELFREKDIPEHPSTPVVHTGVPDEPFTDDQSDSGNYFTGAMVVPFSRLFAG